MQRIISPPPSYESVVYAQPVPFEDLHVPPRYMSATEGRNSILYSQLPPLHDTTKIYLIDNKSADIASLNYQNDHSNYLTSVVQNSDFTPMEASTQTINFDERSRWGADFKSILHTNIPNVTEFMFSNSFRVKMMSSFENNTPTYEWYTLTIPEGNYSDNTVIDLMNNAIVECYMANGRLKGVKEDQIGVKFDTRNFKLGWDPATKLIMAGVYTYLAFHPDIVLLPGCAVDFTTSRLNNLLGIRKRHPYQEGFVIEYDDLVGGNIPALLDVNAYAADNTDIKPLRQDDKGRSYHVGEDGAGGTDTAYRSWYLSYNYGGSKGVRNVTLLTTPDVTCGVEQIYWSLPDLAKEPVTFRASQRPSNYPVVGTELLPLVSRSYFNAAAVYSQMVQEATNQTYVFNRFPTNQILVQPPSSTITSVCENVPALTDHGTVPIKNSISGVQRVTLTDARRRICPYVYKSLGVIVPKVLSSKTF
ncbi:pIII [red squirrel adenovirus 1]|uniref:Penton protein n=1 Tax=red squirrel adenovirus 1 TaxID=2773314 RepID=A0A220A464_9ADEN|nr:pIII [red squirrel adenovirus 1]ARE31884.1 pIII [red squirrel adenovirus 1]WUG45425.1 III [Squirrel mastadenovirus A]